MFNHSAGDGRRCCAALGQPTETAPPPHFPPPLTEATVGTVLRFYPVGREAALCNPDQYS
ncbi:hypothetical protein [Actinophytocola sediminis]